MEKNILDDTIAARLPPARKGKRSYFYDETVPGFGIAVTDKGTKTFFLYRTIGGVPKRVTLGHFPDMSVEAARRKAQEYDIAKDGVEAREIATPVFRPSLRAFYLGVGTLAVAVCLVALAIVGTDIVNFWRSEAALQSLISFAIDDHLNHRDVKFHTADPVDLREALAHELPFAVKMPRIDPGFKVVGGRATDRGEFRRLLSVEWKERLSLFAVAVPARGLRCQCGRQTATSGAGGHGRQAYPLSGALLVERRNTASCWSPITANCWMASCQKRD